MCMMTGAWRLNGITRKRWFNFVNKRKKKKMQNKMRVVMYCRVGTPEKLSSSDIKNETLIVQKDKKALIS